MSFLLYRIDRGANCYRRIAELSAANGWTSLWGKHGAVKRCATRQLPADEGTWHVTERELLVDLAARVSGAQDLSADDLAILDDLVPGTRSKKPVERTVGRILTLDGVGFYHEFNPFLITMREVLNEPAPSDPVALKAWVRPGLDVIPIESSDARLIRTVNYLLYGWQPPRSFSGALLWPQQWDHLKRC